MTDEEVNELLVSIVSAYTATQGKSPSDEFLTMLRNLVSQGKVEEIVEASTLYFKVHGQAKRYISSALPPMILYYHPDLQEIVRAVDLPAWARVDPAWSVRIADNITSDRLPSAVRQTVQSLLEFHRNQER